MVQYLAGELLFDAGRLRERIRGGVGDELSW